MSQPQAITTTSKKPTIDQMLEAGKEQLQKALPKVISSDRFLRVALTEIRKSRKLQECNPVSVCAAVMQAAQLGLEFGSALGHAYLIPYGNEATMQVGYKGLMHLARRSGEIKKFEARAVYDGDVFEYELGTNPFIKHKPTGKQTNLTHVYAIAVFTTGEMQFDVMSREAVEEHRTKYSKNDDTWRKAFDEMAKKTVVKRLIKMLPMTTEIQQLLEMEDQKYTPVFTPEKAAQVAAGQMQLSAGESQAAQITLGNLYRECNDAGINTDDLVLNEDATDQEVLAATQILKERLTKK